MFAPLLDGASTVYMYNMPSPAEKPQLFEEIFPLKQHATMKA
jgi:hypothetical protein